MCDFRESFPVRLVRGEAAGPGPGLLRLLLLPPSLLFAFAAEARHLLYRLGVFSSHRVPCPVASVGNLSVGGTGKTPLVEWLVRELRLLGMSPVVLSRGYGAGDDEVPDELAVLSESLPEFRFVRDADRVRGALTAIERHLADVVVLDDGFQHHRLARQVDLVTVDATDPFGGGHCLPRGPLREPVRALRRADAIVVTRTDQVDHGDLEETFRRLRRAAPKAVLATAEHAPRELKALAGREVHPPGWLDGKSVFAVSGIGNPGAFERTLTGLGAKLAGTARFADHHRYGAEDLAAVSKAAREKRAEAVVTTTKDAVKWDAVPENGPPAFALDVRLRVTSGAEAIRELLRKTLT